MREQEEHGEFPAASASGMNERSRNYDVSSSRERHTSAHPAAAMDPTAPSDADALEEDWLDRCETIPARSGLSDSADSCDEDWIDRCETIPVPKARASMRCTESRPTDMPPKTELPDHSTASCAESPDRLTGSETRTDSPLATASSVAEHVAEPKSALETEGAEALASEATSDTPAEDRVSDAAIATSGPTVTGDAEPVQAAAEAALTAAVAVTAPPSVAEAALNEPGDSGSTSEPGLPARETSEATSTSAQVLPSRAPHGDEIELPPGRGEGTPAPAHDVPAHRASKAFSWVLAAGIVAALGWLVSRTDHGDIRPEVMAGHTSVPVVASDVGQRAPAMTREEPDTSEAKLTAELSPTKLVAAPAEPARESPPPENHATEPARLAAYKTVAVAGRAAANCRYRGDEPGVFRVLVTFQPSGAVEQALLLGTVANPMTRRCIVSRFDGLAVPPFAGNAVRVATDVKLY